MEEMPVCKTIALEIQSSECATAMKHKHTDGKHQVTAHFWKLMSRDTAFRIGCIMQISQHQLRLWGSTQ